MFWSGCSHDSSQRSVLRRYQVNVLSCWLCHWANRYMFTGVCLQKISQHYYQHPRETSQTLDTTPILLTCSIPPNILCGNPGSLYMCTGVFTGHKLASPPCKQTIIMNGGMSQTLDTTLIMPSWYNYFICVYWCWDPLILYVAGSMVVVWGGGGVRGNIEICCQYMYVHN